MSVLRLLVLLSLTTFSRCMAANGAASSVQITSHPEPRFVSPHDQSNTSVIRQNLDSFLVTADPPRPIRSQLVTNSKYSANRVSASNTGHLTQEHSASTRKTTKVGRITEKKARGTQTNTLDHIKEDIRNLNYSILRTNSGNQSINPNQAQELRRIYQNVRRYLKSSPGNPRSRQSRGFIKMLSWLAGYTLGKYLDSGPGYGYSNTGSISSTNSLNFLGRMFNMAVSISYGGNNNGPSGGPYGPPYCVSACCNICCGPCCVVCYYDNNYYNNYNPYQDAVVAQEDPSAGGNQSPARPVGTGALFQDQIPTRPGGPSPFAQNQIPSRPFGTVPFAQNQIPSRPGGPSPFAQNQIPPRPFGPGSFSPNQIPPRPFGQGPFVQASAFQVGPGGVTSAVVAPYQTFTPTAELPTTLRQADTTTDLPVEEDTVPPTLATVNKKRKVHMYGSSDSHNVPMQQVAKPPRVVATPFYHTSSIQDESTFFTKLQNLANVEVDSPMQPLKASDVNPVNSEYIRTEKPIIEVAQLEPQSNTATRNTTRPRPRKPKPLAKCNNDYYFENTPEQTTAASFSTGSAQNKYEMISFDHGVYQDEKQDSDEYDSGWKPVLPLQQEYSEVNANKEEEYDEEDEEAASDDVDDESQEVTKPPPPRYPTASPPRVVVEVGSQSVEDGEEGESDDVSQEVTKPPPPRHPTASPPRLVADVDSQSVENQAIGHDKEDALKERQNKKLTSMKELPERFQGLTKISKVSF